LAPSQGHEIDEQGRVIRHGAYPELTLPALLIGYLLGAVIAVSIGYAALILGFSIEGSELAAILGWGILRGMLRRTSIIENNINQTIASAVNGASAGIMFSVPAVFILARSDPDRYGGVAEFSAPLMVLACITGGVLGLAFIIPLRKQMIDFNRLAYPGGIAVAAILRSPGAGLRKAVLLLGGAVVSGAVYLTLIATLGDDPTWPVGRALELPSFLNITFFLSMMTIGVGFLSGRGGMVFGYGGFICYFLLAPLLTQVSAPEVQEMLYPVAAAEARGEALGDQAKADLTEHVPEVLRLQLFRPCGIGMLIGAAIGGIIAAAPLIRSALKSMQDAARRAEHGTAIQPDEMPIKVLYVAIAAGAVALAVIALRSVPEMTIGRAVAMALLGTLWIWVAGVIVSECLGRTNWSPLSGMTLIAVTILILIVGALGDAAAVISSIMVGAAICVAIAQAGDMMLDLKAGYLVGASPKKQQIAQLLGTWLGPILVVALMFALEEAYEIGSKQLPAPQATALAAVIDGIIGGDVPVGRYAAGAGLGALLACSGLGGIGVMIALGFYMPFAIVLTYTIGCLTRIGVEHFKGRRFVEDVGIPIAAGLIVGEALVGVGNAFYQILSAGV